MAMIAFLLQFSMNAIAIVAWDVLTDKLRIVIFLMITFWDINLTEERENVFFSKTAESVNQWIQDEEWATFQQFFTFFRDKLPEKAMVQLDSVIGEHLIFYGFGDTLSLSLELQYIKKLARNHNIIFKSSYTKIQWHSQTGLLWLLEHCGL